MTTMNNIIKLKLCAGHWKMFFRDVTSRERLSNDDMFMLTHDCDVEVHVPIELIENKDSELISWRYR